MRPINVNRKDLGGTCHNCKEHKNWIEISRSEWEDGKQIDITVECSTPQYDEDGDYCGPCGASKEITV